MKDVAVAIAKSLGSIGVTYLICACLVGADCLIPHKYIFVASDGKKYGTNSKPK